MPLNGCACNFSCATVVVGNMHNIIKLIIPLLLVRELNALYFSVWVRDFQCLPVPSRVKQANKASRSLLNLLQMGLSI
jgi:hypothetical protein